MRAPPRIRTDPSNAFAHHTMSVRVPDILEKVLAQNPDYAPAVAAELRSLIDELRTDGVLPGLTPEAPYADTWLEPIAARRGQTWLGTDWFFAENYVYRRLAEITGFWSTGRDPFAKTKGEEYASDAHRAVIRSAAEIAPRGTAWGWLAALLAASVFGNRIDLSFAAALERGAEFDAGDLLIDDREAAVARLLEPGGDVHIVVDNAGTELSVDLVLAARVLERLNAGVTLHLKVHPAFVSDATPADLDWFLGEGAATAEALWQTFGSAAAELRHVLREARRSGAFRIAPHPFWNCPLSLWDLPADLVDTFRTARLVVLKGDAHYRRAVGDALWPPETPFSEVTAYFPAPLLALRTLKSDPIVGLGPSQVAELDRTDETWRVNARRGVASLGGALRREGASTR